MQKWTARPFSYLSAFAACAVMSLTTGCASGGFKLTRQYAQFVNSQKVVVRVILYILTFVVFAATVLIDMVVLNTMDFWQGKVSAGDYNFQGGDKTYQVRHEFQPGTQLHRSTIQILNKDRKLLQKVVLAETAGGEIEVTIDGRRRGRVHGLSDIPIASLYDKNGQWVEDRVIADQKVAGLK
jgi:hypothetical protein